MFESKRNEKAAFGLSKKMVVMEKKSSLRQKNKKVVIRMENLW